MSRAGCLSCLLTSLYRSHCWTHPTSRSAGDMPVDPVVVPMFQKGGWDGITGGDPNGPRDKRLHLLAVCLGEGGPFVLCGCWRDIYSHRLDCVMWSRWLCHSDSLCVCRCVRHAYKRQRELIVWFPHVSFFYSHIGIYTAFLGNCGRG